MFLRWISTFAATFLAALVATSPGAKAAPCDVIPASPSPAPRERLYGPATEAWHKALQGASKGTLLMGDSLFAGWPRDDLSSTESVINFSGGGDTTANLLWRLQEIAPQRIDVENVAILIGTNDLRVRPACEIVSGILAVAEEMLRRSPSAHIYLLTLLPRGRALKGFTEKIAQVNDTLRLLQSAWALQQNSRIVVIDAHAKFIQACSMVECPLLQDDNLHLTPKGYGALREVMRPALP